jgi:hypothetical protein
MNVAARAPRVNAKQTILAEETPGAPLGARSSSG